MYAAPGRGAQYWQWVKREPGRPDRTRTHLWSRDQPGEALIQKLEQLVFTLDEEDLLKQLSLPQIEERAEIADRAFRQFRAMQTERGMDAGRFADTKLELRRRLDELRNELDEYLAGDYGVKVKSRRAYRQWRDSHQPFHWFVEFYGIMRRGGFDVIIGNPPYIELKTVDQGRHRAGAWTRRRALRRRSPEPGTGARPAGRGPARRAGDPRTRRAGRTAVRGRRIAGATAVPSFAVRRCVRGRIDGQGATASSTWPSHRTEWEF